MSYITEEYYLNDFKGPANEELVIVIDRASKVIDMLTGYKLKNGELDFNNLNPFVKSQIELATAMQTEYFILNGGYETFFQGSLTSVNIGSFSYSKQQEQKIVPDTVIMALSYSGLLYVGMDVIN